MRNACLLGDKGLMPVRLIVLGTSVLLVRLDLWGLRTVVPALLWYICALWGYRPLAWLKAGHPPDSGHLANLM